MAKVSVRLKFFPVLLVLLLYNEVQGSGFESHRRVRRHRIPAEEFSSHQIIQPRLYHSRSKREISASRDVDNGVASSRRHLDHVTVTFDGDDGGRQFVLDLKHAKNILKKINKRVNVRKRTNFVLRCSTFVPFSVGSAFGICPKNEQFCSLFGQILTSKI